MRLWRGGDVRHADFVLVEEGVFREPVVWDMGNPLESPFFSVPYLRSGAGNLSDVTHSWDGSLGIEVDPNGGGDRGVVYEIGAFNELFEGVFPRGGGASFGTNHHAKVLGRGNNREVGPFWSNFPNGSSDAFDSVGGWVDPERYERALLDFKVKAGDVLKEVEIPLKGREVLKGLH